MNMYIFQKKYKNDFLKSNGHLIPYSMNSDEMSRNVHSFRKFPGHFLLTVSFSWFCYLYSLETFFSAIPEKLKKKKKAFTLPEKD